jgi:hypothetical protein
VVIQFELDKPGVDTVEQVLHAGAWCVALVRRFRGKGSVAPRVHAAVAYFSRDSVALEFVPPRLTDEASVVARVGALGSAFADCRGKARWDGRPRRRCERLACGFVSLCHGPEHIDWPSLARG